ncbi:hypothetical protein OQA88_7287 [Cercophora sp. LCS_1]
MSFFQEQLRQRPRLLEKHFLDVIDQAEDADVIVNEKIARGASDSKRASSLPPPAISVSKSWSHISSGFEKEGERIEMAQYVVVEGTSILVVDDVLASGGTLCAVLELPRMAGVDAGDISVIVVAELPAHGGRKFLHEHGFGKVNI